MGHGSGQAHRLSGLARRCGRPPARAPPEDREVDRRAAASARRGAGTATAMVAAANCRTAGPRLSRRSGDACVARDDLSIEVAPVRWTVNGFRDGHCTTPEGDREIAPPWSIVAPEGTVRSPIPEV